MSTATAERTILDAVKPQLYIGGEWRDGGEGATIGVEDSEPYGVAKVCAPIRCLRE